MGRLFIRDLEGKTYDCKFCKTKLALADDIVSRAFHCRKGKAYLFYNVVNVFLGPNEERMMMSGQYTVADVHCVRCAQKLGWKYVAVHESTQKFKEGKYVFERSTIMDREDLELLVDTDASGSNAENA